MCVELQRLNDGTEVPCHKCWQCRENKINDWVGRCIAEQKTAAAAHSITLTYGRDMSTGAELHERAAVLTYSDVQKYFKRLRTKTKKRPGYPCRYFAVGEYGSMKGRAHWHLVVFWQDKVPPHELNERFNEPHWEHGFSYWELPNSNSIRYVCKYLQKDIGKAERQGHLAMSKKPPLGAEYFDLLARKYALNGLAPQDEFYSFDEARDAQGEKLRFFLRGVSLDNFCAAFLRHWQELHGDRHPPQSQLIEDYCDRIANYEPPLAPVPFSASGKPWIDPPEGYKMRFAENLNTYVAEHLTRQRLFWSFNLEGQRAWQNVIRTENGAIRERHSVNQLAARYREATGRPPASAVPPRTTGGTR